MSMTNKQLKELLSQYPDESFVYIRDDNCEGSCRHIVRMNIEYMDNDLFEVPDIVLD